jgi:hypothetical protein
LGGSELVRPRKGFLGSKKYPVLGIFGGKEKKVKWKGRFLGSNERIL